MALYFSVSLLLGKYAQSGQYKVACILLVVVQALALFSMVKALILVLKYAVNNGLHWKAYPAQSVVVASLAWLLAALPLFIPIAVEQDPYYSMIPLAALAVASIFCSEAVLVPRYVRPMDKTQPEPTSSP